jgi:hypothetical protein
MLIMMVIFIYLINWCITSIYLIHLIHFHRKYFPDY